MQPSPSPVLTLIDMQVLMSSCELAVGEMR